jgi:hypothetical protein
MAARHAALAIHALSDTDQQWMLSRLPGARRQALEPLLAELRELGIPRDPAVVADLNASSRQASAAGWSGSDAEWLARLPAARVVAGLADESPEVVSKLLACRPWPWAQAVAAAHGLEGVPLAAGHQAPRLLESLSAGLARRLRAPAAPRPAIVAEPRDPQPLRPAESGWRLQRWFGSWKGGAKP